MNLGITLKELFKSPPRPIRTPSGLYECRRCRKRFEHGPFSPCRANRGYMCVGGNYYWNTLTCHCNIRPDRETYGVADLIGVTVTITQPENTT